MHIKVYNQQGKEMGTAEASDAVFAVPWKADLVWQVVHSQTANRRQGSRHAKGRGEVRGGGRKPWRQKGTGRARHGSIRSPIWKGGGVTHGPKKEENFKKKINKKMAIRALAAVLSAKVRDGEFLVLDEIALPRPKTKEASSVARHLSHISGFDALASRSVLLVLPEHRQETFRAFRNLPRWSVAEARNVSALDLLRFQFIVAPQPAVRVFEARVKK